MCFIKTSSIIASASSINYEDGYRSYSSIDLKILEEIILSTKPNLKDAITVGRVTCKSESELLDYRNWAISTKANAAKGGTKLISQFSTRNY